MTSRFIQKKYFLDLVIAGIIVLTGEGKLRAQDYQYYICGGDTFSYPEVYSDGFYKIDFGDGTIDSGYHVLSHTYLYPGTYTASIKEISKSKTTGLVYIIHSGTLPLPGFTQIQKCSEYQFLNSVSDSVIVKDGWYWDFGDGTGITEKSPAHIYKASGTYAVSLTCGKGTGCSKTIARQIGVTNTQSTGFDIVVNGTKALFMPRDTSARSYHWEFGDSTTASAKSPEHTFKNDGRYPVSLILEKDSSCIEYYTDSVSTGSAGIQTINANSNVFKVYPNPARNIIHIHYGLKATYHVSVSIYSITGKLVAVVFNGIGHQGDYHIDIKPGEAGLSPGIYLLKGEFGEVYLTQKLVVQE
jgi:PKD repeat protein